MEWEGSYYWPGQHTINVKDAISLREKNSLETGDCWCHEDCYNSSPRRGTKLFPRNRKSCPHFWRGPGNFSKTGDCEYALIQKENNESTRYSQFYHDLRRWLVTDEANKKLNFSEFNESRGSKYSDFVLSNIQKKKIPWDYTEVLVIHKNRKRHPSSKNYIIIDLSQWLPNQIVDFEEFGKRKLIEEFNQLIARSNEEKIRQLEQQKRLAESNAQISQKEEKANKIRIRENDRIESMEFRRESIIDDLSREMEFSNFAIKYIENNSKEIILKVKKFAQDGITDHFWEFGAIRDEFPRLSNFENSLEFTDFFSWVRGRGHDSKIGTEMSFKDIRRQLDYWCTCSGSNDFKIEKLKQKWRKSEITRDSLIEETELIENNRKNSYPLCISLNNFISEQVNKQGKFNLRTTIEQRIEIDRKKHFKSYPHKNIINKFRLAIESRQSYYEEWLTHYYDTNYPSKYEKKQKDICELRLWTCRRLLNKSNEEYVYQYSIKNYSGVEDFTADKAYNKILEGLTKGHRMLHMTRSQWMRDYDIRDDMLP